MSVVTVPSVAHPAAGCNGKCGFSRWYRDWPVGHRLRKREVCGYAIGVFAVAVQQPVFIAAPVRRRRVIPQATDGPTGAGVSAAVRGGRFRGAEPAGGAQSASGGAHYQEVLHADGRSGGSDLHRHHRADQSGEHVPPRQGHPPRHLCKQVY